MSYKNKTIDFPMQYVLYYIGRWEKKVTKRRIEMNPKVHIHSFRANNKELTLNDIIKDIKIYKTDYCVDVHVELVNDKYLEVSQSLYMCSEFSGETFDFVPYDIDYDYDSFFHFSITIETDFEYASTMFVPLKYEYQLKLIKDTVSERVECDNNVTEWIDE